MIVMWVVVIGLFYLAVYRGFEPLLLIPIGFGALLANLPTEGLVNAPVGDHAGGLFYYISQGITLELFPPLIFLGVGALTDFGPLIANPRTLLLGAAASARPREVCDAARTRGARRSRRELLPRL